MDHFPDDAKPCQDTISSGEEDSVKANTDKSPAQLEEELGRFFEPLRKKPLKKLSDEDIHKISHLLGAVNESWGNFPRLYIVLRVIDCVGDLDLFIEKGMTDLWFPFTVP